MKRDEREIGADLAACGRFLPEVLDGMERELATSAWGLWEGFSAFCRSTAGVEAEKLAAVILEPAEGRIKGLQDRAERLGIEPDAEAIEEVREGLAEAWRVRLGRGI
jgi:phytoene/squalene synthetase